MSRPRYLLPVAVIMSLVLAACGPTATDLSSLSAPCATTPMPTVAVIEFENTTGSSGTTVVGVETTATARLITLLKESGCYVIVERSELQGIIERQGMESLDPIALAKAAGAGFVVTGTVTRATIAEPGGSIFGVTVGATTAEVEVDVRATDIITGIVEVSMTGSGTSSNPNVRINRVLGTSISYDDPTVGPLLAEAANGAVNEVVAAIRAEF